MLRAQPPTHRPAWMVVLAATMLLYGGRMLVEGLQTVRDPKAITRYEIRSVARAPAADQAVSKLEPVLNAIHDRHKLALRIEALVSIGFGLFTLFAVAAVLSRDRNGRRLALLTALFGIAYQLGKLPLAVGLARETVSTAGPLMAEVMAAGAGAGRSQAELLAAIEATALVVILLAAVGVAWCVLLLVYFGGRRGRELYGLHRS